MNPAYGAERNDESTRASKRFSMLNLTYLIVK